ncbi:MAG: type II secretion system F family protein [Chloroflexota bacterium]
MNIAVVVPILIFTSVVIVVLAFGDSRSAVIEDRLQKYGFGSNQRRAADLAKPFSQRVLLPVLTGFFRLGSSLTPLKVKEKVESRLTLAGNPYGLGPAQFLSISFGVGFILPVLYLGVFKVSMGRPLEPNDALVVTALFGLGLYLLPSLWLGLEISSRQKQIERRLPDAMDLITICVEAGLTLEAAFARVVTRTKGPLADELRRALQEVNMGKARSKALKDIGKRTGVADLQSILAALVQGEEMGTGIANVLRVQSDAMRVKRQQRAQEQAHSAPVKMLFPLVMFILPAMFVVILGPAAIRLFDVFTSMK